jgi:hypothetical protein
LAEAARLTSDDPTVLDDRRNFTRPLQHGNVGKRVAVPNHDVGELAGGNHADPPSRPMSQALLLVLATIASIGGIPTSLTNNSASLPCQRPMVEGNAKVINIKATLDDLLST